MFVRDKGGVMMWCVYKKMCEETIIIEVGLDMACQICNMLVMYLVRYTIWK